MEPQLKWININVIFQVKSNLLFMNNFKKLKRRKKIRNWPIIFTVNTCSLYLLYCEMFYNLSLDTQVKNGKIVSIDKYINNTGAIFRENGAKVYMPERSEKQFWLVRSTPSAIPSCYNNHYAQENLRVVIILYMIDLELVSKAQFVFTTTKYFRQNLKEFTVRSLNWK